ncbi:retron St85 family RNA-directed DNA polymerase [Enterobacter sp. ENT02]|uniref:retron St85 family RNA-directed DNA polymerase n=1 Tax=Enterobacter sp. ENT02 TaxID=2854767 RepID=UPI001C45761B|nr:retron St85 family RNA-directed DNA polymerase [Enterobacter sp. ENT02]MBV7557939.1 retron St85 family RNA-directed DNA polymerase [Enterobacter sp. ENT02]
MLIEYLAKVLLLEADFIFKVANEANSHYGKFSVPKKNGGTRIVYQPSKELKVLQRLLHDNILSKLPVHPNAVAYQKGSSVYKHASIHKAKRFMLKLDFEAFFDSITKNDVKEYINDNKQYFGDKWLESDTDLLVKLVCFNGRLTMGAVSSPVMSNAICFKLDHLLNEFCLSKGVTYSRYADDMYFSTNEENVLKLIPPFLRLNLKTLRYPSKLWINRKKTLHMSKKNKMMVTGVTLTTDGGVSLGRDKKRMVKALIFKWKDLPEEKRLFLKGYLSYCKSVEPLFINRLCAKYSSELIDEIQRYQPVVSK